MSQPVEPPAQPLIKEYRWYNSSNIQTELQCGVIRLQCGDDVFDAHELRELSVSAYIVCNQIQVHDPPLSTLFGDVNSNRKLVQWDHVLSFPVKIRDLSADSLLILTIWRPDGTPYAGTSMRIFSEQGCMRLGKQKLLLFPQVEGDPNVVFRSNSTPGDYFTYFEDIDYEFQMEKVEELHRIQSAQQAAGKSDMKNEWLDSLLMTRILQSKQDYRDETNPSFRVARYSDELWGQSLDQIELHKYSYLIVEMPSLFHPILYEERQYPSVEPHHPPTSLAEVWSRCIIEGDNNAIEFTLAGRQFDPNWLNIVVDWDMDQENLCEEQNRRLTHNVRRGTADSTVKPNKDQKMRIDKIINAVGNQMSTDDMDFLYRFRYSLTENKKALIKFLFSVNWEEDTEVEELPTLLALWKQRAPIDVADALKLLSKEKSFEHSYVREYAVEVLRLASDDELLLFLLQLVQALRYEPAVVIPVATPLSDGSDSNKNVVDFPLEQSIIGVSNTVRSSFDQLQFAQQQQDLQLQTRQNNNLVNLSPLGRFLVDRAANSPVVANYLYWYLKVETQLEENGVFHTTWEIFMVHLSEKPETKTLFKRLLALDDYISQITAAHREAVAQRGRKKGDKEQALIKRLVERDLQSLPSGFDWVPLPLDPAIKLSGLIPTTVKMFASAVYPVVIEFKELPEEAAAAGGLMTKQRSNNNLSLINSSEAINAQVPTSLAPILPPVPPVTAVGKEAVVKVHKVMFKSGDDLRQDQLVMQMISLMDNLLKRVNLDLKLLTYGILAVGQTDGIMEFVQNSMPISAIQKNYGTISEYLRTHNPDKNGPYEISPIALDTFVKSCAGCCVITFILGIGDRHLDNIMMNTSGQMFHIDFGWIFGQDPKPFPPPFRLNKPMVDAMGGEDSEHYARFKTFCCQSYNWLRKSANLILNLLSLVGDAGIQDISKRSDLGRVLQKVEEKFRLDLTDEQAEQYFLGLINESLYSIAPKIMESLHKIAVSMRG